MTSRAGSYHHGDLRRALLDTVVELVAEQGNAANVTLREVARRAGVSHAAPYRHFQDKEELLAEVATEGFGLLAVALSEARDGVRSAEERFVGTGLAYLRFALEHRGYIGVMHGPGVAKGRTPALQRAANEAFQVLKGGAHDAGVEDVAEARRVGIILWSFVHGLAVLAGNAQIPPSVGASPAHLAELGLRRLFRSFRSRV